MNLEEDSKSLYAEKNTSAQSGSADRQKIQLPAKAVVDWFSRREKVDPQSLMFP